MFRNNRYGASGSDVLGHDSTERSLVRPDKGEPFAAAKIIHAPLDILFCGFDGGEMPRDIARIEYAIAAVTFLFDRETPAGAVAAARLGSYADYDRSAAPLVPVVWFTRPPARSSP